MQNKCEYKKYSAKLPVISIQLCLLIVHNYAPARREMRRAGQAGWPAHFAWFNESLTRQGRFKLLFWFG